MSNVPELRFSEFSGGWEEKKLDEVGTVITGTTPKTSEVENYGSEYLWASPVDLGSKKYITTTKNKLSKIGFNKTRNIPKGSILVTCIGSTIGKIGVASCNMSTNQQINTIVCSDEYDSEFVYYRIQSNLNKILKYSANQAVPIINKSTFSKIEYMFPAFQEQQKIADFLSILDSRIEIQEKTIESIEEIKKGYMQKIFSREIKFKDDNGEEYPEWESKQLGEIGSFYNGLSGKNKESFEDGNKEYISYMNVFSNTMAKNKDLPLVQLKENEKQNKVLYGDVLFTQSSETLEEVGMSSVWLGDNEVYLNSFCFGYRFSNLDKINPVFMGYNFRTSEMRKMIMIEGQGSTRFNLSSSRLSNTKLLIPNLVEQKKIASFLSTFDEKLEIEEQILETLKDIKKGLLQRMFV